MGIAGARHAADRFEAAMARRPALKIGAPPLAGIRRVERGVGLVMLVCILLALLLWVW